MTAVPRLLLKMGLNAYSTSLQTVTSFIRDVSYVPLLRTTFDIAKWQNILNGKMTDFTNLLMMLQ